MSLLPLLISRREGTEGTGPGATDNCILWLRSDKPHVSAPEVVDLSGSLVNIWYDQSGLGNDAISSGSSRPTYNASSVTCPPFGVFPGIEFDGVDDFLVIGSLVSSLSAPGDTPTIDGQPSMAMYIVFQASDQTAAIASIRHVEDGSGTTDGISIQLGPGTLRNEISVDAGPPDVSVTLPLILGLGYDDSFPHLISNHYDADLSSDHFRLRFDASIELDLDTVTATQLFAEANEVNVGRFGTGGFYFSGTIFEILVYTKDNPTIRSIVESYLTGKWCAGLTTPDPPCLWIDAAAPGEATLNWQPGLDDGGTPITGWELTRTGGGPTVVTDFGAAATAHTDTGLSDGVIYTYTLRAENGLGFSIGSNVLAWAQPDF